MIKRKKAGREFVKVVGDRKEGGPGILLQGASVCCCGSRKKLVTIKLDQDCDGGRGWAYRSTLLPMTCLLKNGSKGGGDFWSFLEKQYVLFETIHPFDDGNGRTGRSRFPWDVIETDHGKRTKVRCSREFTSRYRPWD